MEKRQTLEQQEQRLNIASDVAQLKAQVKLLENTRELNEKRDTATTFTVYPAKSKTTRCQGDNLKRSGNADRRKVIYNDSYQEYDTKSHQFIDEKLQMQMQNLSEMLKEVLIEMQIWGWKETET